MTKDMDAAPPAPAAKEVSNGEWFHFVSQQESRSTPLGRLALDAPTNIPR